MASLSLTHALAGKIRASAVRDRGAGIKSENAKDSEEAMISWHLPNLFDLFFCLF